MSELAHRQPIDRIVGPRRVQTYLLAYGLVAAALMVAVLSSKAPGPIMAARSQDVSASIAVLDRGGPPLLASQVPWRSGLPAADLRPTGVTDDEGIYLYLPLLGEVTGEHDPNVLMKWLYLACMGLLVLVFPLVFYELFGSIVGAVAAPILAVWKFQFAQTLDLYWVLAWVMLLGLPVLVLAYRWWTKGRRRAALWLMFALMLVGSFSTSIRIHSGVPLLLGALGIVLLTGGAPLRFWQQPRWWIRPAIAVGLVLAYLSISTFGFAAARAYRNHVIHQPSFGSTYPTQHPFWHNAYIGLGYVPNKYGIAWSDTVSADYVDRTHPGTQFLSKTYEATLRHRYVQIARHDPGFVARNFWVKARVIVADAVDRFWPVLLLLPLALLVGAFRRPMLVALLIAIPAALLGALAPVLTIPDIRYELEWLGTFGALYILLLVWLWRTLRDMLAHRWPDELQPLRRRPDPAALTALADRLRASRKAWVVAGAIVLTIVLAGAARPAPEPSSSSLYQSGDTPLAPATIFNTPPLMLWRFDGKLAPGWKLAAPAFTQPDNGQASVPGLYVLSTMTTSEDDLVGPWVTLPAGKYELVGSARALVGGFQLSLRNEKGTAIATASNSMLSDALTAAIPATFTVSQRTRVRAFVSAWSSFPNASAWVIWGLELVKL